MNAFRLKRGGLALESLWAFFIRALGTGSGFLMNLAITRTLGASEAGYYFLSLAVITFLSSFCRMGLDNTVVRFVGGCAAEQNWGGANSAVRQSLAATLLFSTACAALIWLTAPLSASWIFNKPELSSVLRAISPGLIGLSLCFLLSYALQAVRTVTGAVFAQSIGIGLGMVAVSFLLSNAEQAGRAYTLISIAVALLALFWWQKSHPRQKGEFPRQRLWASALPLWIVTGTTALQQWSGQFVAGAFVPSEELARFAVAQRTSLLVSFLLIAVNLVVAPRFAALYQQGKIEDLRRIAQSSVRIILALVTPVIAVLFFGADWIMRIFGPEFPEGANLLRILAIGQFVNAATGSVGYLLMMSGHERDSRNIALFIGPLAIGLALALTPVFGATGAATATAIAVASQNLLAGYFVKKRLGFSTMAIWQK